MLNYVDLNGWVNEISHAHHALVKQEQFKKSVKHEKRQADSNQLNRRGKKLTQSIKK